MSWLHSACCPWEMTMIVDGGPVRLKTLARSLSVVIALVSAAPCCHLKRRQKNRLAVRPFEKGCGVLFEPWKSPSLKTSGISCSSSEMTRCVDPTHAMKATFSTNSIGSCHSSRPEKVNNKYIFSNRCDYMGPVSTVITVQSDEAYTEVNELRVGKLPRTDLVIAKRIGDCREDSAALSPPSDLTIEH